jgi:hypothetical protein
VAEYRGLGKGLLQLIEGPFTVQIEVKLGLFLYKGYYRSY